MRMHWSEGVQSDHSIWNVLDTVLELVSRFVSEDSLMPFFYNLVFGRKLLPGSPTGYGRLQTLSVEFL